ncbi:putative zinc finger in N-recognin [Dictyocaulus viviparus]|uniref:Putative zinc finger in N-recognin n=1 Tax=Dictyocaulus viviparus TaxID=29172 RepID=A0A0D8Y4C2_DICVI|nr:putative zinc finger in N-recognin [Dictyocaulus viviparus]
MAEYNGNLLDDIDSKKEESIGQSSHVSSKPNVHGEQNSQNDGETDELLTIQDILDIEEFSKESARVLYGAQDSTVCTYPEGYKPRQTLFACLTCASNPEVNEAGVCYGCSVHCHDGHNIIELFTKRRFRCDCGNSKFTCKCTLFEEKDASNKDNTYNQNFAGLFCVCKKTFPCEVNENMHQCVICEDWFHLSHLDEKCAMLAEEREKSGQADFTLLCKNCSSRLPFLSRLSICGVDDGVLCLSAHAEFKEGPFLLTDGFRKRLCRCQNCLVLYEKSGCEYLIDSDDDIEEFTKENIEKTKDEKEPDDDTIVNELVQTAGREAAIHALEAFNDLKRNLQDFFCEMHDEGVDVITAEHVKSFFDKIKRSRIEDNTGDDV